MDEKLSTRIAEAVERRLRLYAAVHDLKIGEVVNRALDEQLPSLEELAAEVARDPQHSKHAPANRPTVKEAPRWQH